SVCAEGSAGGRTDHVTLLISLMSFKRERCNTRVFEFNLVSTFQVNRPTPFFKFAGSN
ncbi:hypothetical protein L9F63_008374, partial [Diploptera punctata]